MIWFIGVGGALGAVTRFWLGYIIGNRWKEITAFPLATWVVNVSGSALLGVLAHLHMAAQMSEAIWLFTGVGFCSAYTTFSTFGYEVVQLLEKQRWRMAAAYVSASVVLSIIVAFIGWWGGGIFLG